MAWAAVIAGGVSLASGLIAKGAANKRRKAAEGALEGQANSFQSNKSILDYYNEAKKRYNADPTQTSTYKIQKQNIDSNTAQAIGSSQDRHGGLASISRIMQGANDASGKAVMNAEEVQGQNLNRMGQAAGIKTTEDQKKFDMIYNLNAMKAGQAAQASNIASENMYKGLGSIASGLGSKFGGRSSGSGSPSDMDRMSYNPETISSSSLRTPSRIRIGG